jgi:hypothetical protein
MDGHQRIHGFLRAFRPGTGKYRPRIAGAESKNAEEMKLRDQQLKPTIGSSASTTEGQNTAKV